MAAEEAAKAMGAELAAMAAEAAAKAMTAGTAGMVSVKKEWLSESCHF